MPADHPASPRYRDVTVRDLAWLLFSPDLLDAGRAGAPLARPMSSGGERDATIEWLDSLDRDPAALHAEVRRPPLKLLGLYAESLLEYFIAHGPHTRLIAANVPLRASGLTLGEVDFLLENARGERLHWELAVKFYLHIGGDGGIDTLANFVGPNLQDRFDIKHGRLLRHQLGLSARDEFASLGFEGPWRAELLVKGRLFYRDLPASPPSELAGDHLRGWWKTVSEWRESAGDEVCAVLPRLDWLAERDSSTAEQVSVENLSSPLMVATYDPDTGRERSRGFIVPDDWPERAARFTTT